MSHKFRVKELLVIFILLLWAAPSAVLGETIPTADIIARSLVPTKSTDEKKIQTMGVSKKLSYINPKIHIQIPFDLNQYLISPKAVPYLQALGQALSRDTLRGYTFEIQGHTCNLGTQKHNRWLSQKRAESVRDYLTAYFKLSPDQLHVKGYGEDEPIPEFAKNSTEEERKKNRRVTVVNTLKAFETASTRPFCKVEVKYLRGKKEKQLLPEETLTSRDNYNISFIPDRSSYVYVCQVDSLNNITQIFPNKNFTEKHNPVSAGEIYRLPSGVYEWLELDDNKGQEEIILIAYSEKPDEPQICSKLLTITKPIVTMGIKGVRETHVSTKPFIEKKLPLNMDKLFTWKFRFNHQ